MPLDLTDADRFTAAMRVEFLEIGQFHMNLARDRVWCDTAAALLYGLPAVEAAFGITWETLTANFHPNDKAECDRQRLRLMESGGLFAFEHRVIPAPDKVRWLLVRGRYERNPEGEMTGRGIVLDTTALRIDARHANANPIFQTQLDGAPLDRLADHLITMWKLVEGLDRDQAAALQPALRALTLKIGRQVAQVMTKEPPLPSAPRSDTSLH